MTNYNSISSIDKLIERIEGSEIKKEKCDNRLLSERQKKLNQLKALKKELEEAEQKRKVNAQIQRENEELDKAIELITQSIRGKETKSSEVRLVYTPNYLYDPSESRCGESDW